MLEDFLEKDTVPLFVYVIDGKMRLRPSVSLTSCILNVTSHRYRKDTSRQRCLSKRCLPYQLVMFATCPNITLCFRIKKRP